MPEKHSCEGRRWLKTGLVKVELAQSMMDHVLVLSMPTGRNVVILQPLANEGWNGYAPDWALRLGSQAAHQTGVANFAAASK